VNKTSPDPYEKMLKPLTDKLEKIVTLPMVRKI
jgi:hypothetical protein